MRREMRSKWLQTACLNVVIAALCYNPSLTILLLQRPLAADTGVTLLTELIRRWLANISHLVGYNCHILYLYYKNRFVAIWLLIDWIPVVLNSNYATLFGERQVIGMYLKHVNLRGQQSCFDLDLIMVCSYIQGYITLL